MLSTPASNPDIAGTYHGIEGMHVSENRAFQGIVVGQLVRLRRRRTRDLFSFRKREGEEAGDMPISTDQTPACFQTLSKKHAGYRRCRDTEDDVDTKDNSAPDDKDLRRSRGSGPDSSIENGAREPEMHNAGFAMWRGRIQEVRCAYEYVAISLSHSKSYEVRDRRALYMYVLRA